MSGKLSSTCPRFKGIKHGAFTLIELLVVISIVSMLIALLLPGLNKARLHSRIIKCQTQMKQVYSAMEMYYIDHGDPKWTIPSRPWVVGDLAGTPPRSWELHHRYSPTTDRQPNGFGFLVRGDYLGNGDVLYCPDVYERNRDNVSSPVVTNGQANPAALYRNGASTGRTTFLYRMTVNHDGKYLQTTNHTTVYNNADYQWVTRELNARYKKYIFSDLGLSFYNGMYSHGKEVLNATYFDGSIVGVKNAYADNCGVLNSVVDGAFGGNK